MTAASGAVERRFLLDADTRFPLDTLLRGSVLGARREECRGAVVVLRIDTQLATALAMLELDGLARRLVICTPDLPDEHLRYAIDAAEATIIVGDREVRQSGITRIPA